MHTLIDLVAESAARFQDRPAMTVRAGLRDQVWSHAQLWRAVQAVAGALQERGVGKGERVLLIAPNSPHYVASLLGIMLRGAIAVPLDLGSTPEFIARVAEDTGAVALIGNAQGELGKLPRYTFDERMSASAPAYAGERPRPGARAGRTPADSSPAPETPRCD